MSPFLQASATAELAGYIRVQSAHTKEKPILVVILVPLLFSKAGLCPYLYQLVP